MRNSGPALQFGRAHLQGRAVTRCVKRYVRKLVFGKRSSLRQVHAAQQVLKARLPSQGVQPEIHPGPRQSIRPFVIRLF